MAFDSSLLGLPVELRQISRELKKLWEASGGAKSRASLVNFVVFNPGTESLDENTRLISEFTRDHACRAMLLATEPSAEKSGVRAWINAHCHRSRAGASQVCCEQITIVLDGAAEHLLTSVLFANLDSDLPLYLWWRGPWDENLNAQVWNWVDRLIFDSRSWGDPAEAFTVLENSRRQAGSRMILCDLNWTRSLHLRQAVAQTFDHPDVLAELPRITRLRVTHAPDSRSTALLFAAWIAAQLGWESLHRNETGYLFRNAEGAEVAVQLEAVDGPAIGACEFLSSQCTIRIQCDCGSQFYRAEVRPVGGNPHQHLLPGGREDIASLLDDELTFGGRHRVYLKALAVAQTLF